MKRKPAPRIKIGEAHRALTQQAREAECTRLSRVTFIREFQAASPSISQQAIDDLTAALREGMSKLPTLRLRHNEYPMPRAIVDELEAVQQRLIDASVRLRSITVSTLLRKMAERIGDEAISFRLHIREGRPPRVQDRGLQVLAASIEEHLQRFHFGDLDLDERRRLVLRILNKASVGKPPRPDCSAKILADFFTPKRFFELKEN